jgi:ATP-dependent protease HslVU (ClpYQ) peptidase subunit
MATTGDASLGLVLRSYFKRMRAIPSLHTVEDIFEAIRRMHAVLKEEYFLNPEGQEDDPFECSQMEALIANPSGIFGIYALRSVMEYSKFYAFGSGAHLALGALYASYDRLESAEEIARLAVEAAAEFDDGTGLPVTTHVVKLKKGHY